MEIGIVGLPNVGKSTLFNALTGAGVAAENFPFTTIDPNVGIVPLDDPRLKDVAEVTKSKKILPASIRFVDIAGLVEGANKGEGLGNQFLSHIRNVDAIVQVIRCFNDVNVANSLGRIDPLASAGIIETEMLLADLQLAQKALEKYRKASKAGDAEMKNRVLALEEIIRRFEQGQLAFDFDVPREISQEYSFLTSKPVIYVLNVDESGLSEEFKEAAAKLRKKSRTEVIALSARLEAEILELPLEERGAYYQEAGITTPGINRLAVAGKDVLSLVCFITSNENETRAWLVPRGTSAQKAAGKIHSDIEKGFIRAEVCRYKDLKELKTMKAVQEKGLMSLEGKDYVVEEGDIIYFRFNK